MNHKRAQRHLSEYLEGSLSRRARSGVALHLEDCGECQTELRELRFTISLLRGLEDPEPPENLTESVLRRIAAGEAEPSWSQRAERRLNRAREWVSLPQFALPAAGLAGFLAVFWLVPGLSLPDAPGFFSRPPEGSVAQTAARTDAVRPRPPQRGAVTGSFAFSGPSGLRVAPARVHRGRLSLASAGGSASRVSEILAPFPYVVEAREPVVLRSADEWIDVLIERPSETAAEPTRLSELERELWVTYIARRAVETDRFERLLRALESSPEPVASALAEDFALLGGRR